MAPARPLRRSGRRHNEVPAPAAPPRRPGGGRPPGPLPATGARAASQTPLGFVAAGGGRGVRATRPPLALPPDRLVSSPMRRRASSGPRDPHPQRPNPLRTSPASGTSMSALRCLALSGPPAGGGTRRSSRVSGFTSVHPFNVSPLAGRPFRSKGVSCASWTHTFHLHAIAKLGEIRRVRSLSFVVPRMLGRLEVQCSAEGGLGRTGCYIYIYIYIC